MALTVTDTQKQEFATRLERVRAVMETEGLEALIVADDAASPVGGHTRYLSNVGLPGAAPGGRQSVIVVPAQGDAIHIVPPGFLGCVFEFAKDRSMIEHVRASNNDWSSPYEPRFAEGVAAAIVDAGLESARIGVSGTYLGIDRIFAALSRATFVSMDEPDLVWRLRANKSAWEVERLVEARRIAGLAQEAFAETARPGTSTHRAMAEAKYVAASAGAEEVSVYCGGGKDPWFFGEDGGPDRLFVAGDVWSYEINTRYDGYCCQLPGFLAIGEDPGAYHDDVVITARKAYEAMCKAAAPGVTGEELWNVGSAITRAAGLQHWGQFGHGIGLSLEPLTLRVWPRDQVQLQEGSCFVLHPAVVDQRGGAPVMVGDELTLRDGVAVALVDLLGEPSASS